MVIVNLVFFMVILITTTIYNFRVESKGYILERYLSFIMINSFFFFYIFEIKSVLWISLICAVGLILGAKLIIRDKIIYLFIAILFFAGYRVPVITAEFETYLIEKHGIHCSAIECVELVEVETEVMRQMQATNYSIQSLYLDSHFFFAQGEIILNNKNDRTIKAINIAGFWFQIE